MRFRTFVVAVLSGLMALLLSGCSASMAVPVTGASAPETSGRTDLCSNELVPIRQGASWSYVNTGASTSPVTLTTTISGVRPDGFTVATSFDDGTTMDQEWACKPGGLVAHSLGAAQAVLGLSLQEMSASLLMINPAGVTLPNHLAPGKSWQYSVDVTGNVSRANNTVDVDGKVNTALNAVGMKTVTVPAGTFNAMVIKAKTTFVMNADLYGLYIPVNSSVQSTFWFAPGVGWVKSIQSGDLPGMAVNSVTELQSYQIP